MICFILNMASGASPTVTQTDLDLGIQDRSLNIGVIGAGIAGLGAAVALGRAGHHVEVTNPPATHLPLIPD